MIEMVGDMTCEEVTFLIKDAKETLPSNIEADLRSYILGESQFMPKPELIAKLENWKDKHRFSTSQYAERLKALIDKALANLQ
jgi:hypothetical protein